MPHDPQYKPCRIYQGNLPIILCGVDLRCTGGHNTTYCARGKEAGYDVAVVRLIYRLWRRQGTILDTSRRPVAVGNIYNVNAQTQILISGYSVKMEYVCLWDYAYAKPRFWSWLADDDTSRGVSAGWMLRIPH